MTKRQRMLAVIDGKLPDRDPWVPRLNLWYNFHKNEGTLPITYKNCRQREIEKRLRMGRPAHPANDLTRQSIMDFRLSERIQRKTNVINGETTMIFNTPLGRIRTRLKVTPETVKMGLLQRLLSL